MNGFDSLLEPPISTRMANIAVATTSDETLLRLRVVFDQFMTTLADNEEIGLVLTSFGVSRTIHVERIAALGPVLLRISGTENGAPVELVQHITQLNFLLMRVKPTSPDGVPRRAIGFVSHSPQPDSSSG